MAETNWTPGESDSDGDPAGAGLPARPFSRHGYTGIHTAPGGGGGGLARRGHRGASAAPPLPGDGWADYVAMLANLIQAGSTTEEQAARIVEELVKTSSRVHALIAASLADVAVILRPAKE